uniref:Uncharacterized protein n=1 Tax=Cyprinus carpio carpio TaxID=630221 RepID=A0A9J7Y529_CYPCA
MKLFILLFILTILFEKKKFSSTLPSVEIPTQSNEGAIKTHRPLYQAEAKHEEVLGLNQLFTTPISLSSLVN